MEETKKQLQELVASGNLKKAFKKILALPDTEIVGLRPALTTQSARYSKLKKDATFGRITDDAADTGFVQVSTALLSLINLLGTEEARTPPAPAEDVKQTKILFLAANPQESSRLRLDEEIRDIQNGLDRAKHRDQFALLQRWAVRTKDLQRAMLDERPQIVHFSGHGVTLKKEGDGTITPGSRAFANLNLDEDIKMNLENYSGGIMIENEDGSPKIVSASALGALFELFEGSIQCVLLNACHSKAQAEALIKAGVPYVIGMNTEVPDKTAIVFATRFYDALGAGETIDKAFRHGKAALLLDDLPGADIPELIQPK